MKRTVLIFSAVVLTIHDICAQNVKEATTPCLKTPINATSLGVQRSTVQAGTPAATPATQKYPEGYARLLKNTFKRRRPWRGSPYYSSRRFRGGTSNFDRINFDYDIPTPNYNQRTDGGYQQYQYQQPAQQPQVQDLYQAQYQQAPLYSAQQQQQQPQQPQQPQQTRGIYPTDYQQYATNYQYQQYPSQQQYPQQQYPQQPQYAQQSAYQQNQYPQSQYTQPQDTPTQQQPPNQQQPYPVQPQQQQNTGYQQQQQMPYSDTQQQYQQQPYQQTYQHYQQPQQYQYPQQPPPSHQIAQYPQRDETHTHSNYLLNTAQQYAPPSGDLGEPPMFYSHYPPGRMVEEIYGRQNTSYDRYPYLSPFYRVPPRRRFRARGRNLRPFFSYVPPTVERQAKGYEYWGTNQLSESMVTELSHTYKELIDKFSGPNYLKQVKEKAKSDQILHIHTGANFTRTTITSAPLHTVTTLKT